MSKPSTKDVRLTDCVLIDKLNGLLGSEDKAVVGEVHKALLNIEVSGELLPADLHSPMTHK